MLNASWVVLLGMAVLALTVAALVTLGSSPA